MAGHNFTKKSAERIGKAVRIVESLATDSSADRNHSRYGVNAFRPCKVEKDGGSPGSQTAPCTFTYKVMLLDGTVLAEGMTPRTGRPRIGKMEAQEDVIPKGQDAIGQVFIDKDGTLQLWDAGEVLDLRPCNQSAPASQVGIVGRVLSAIGVKP